MAGSESGPKLLELIAGSKPIEIFLTLVVYSIYATVIALSLVPSFYLILTAAPPAVTIIASAAADEASSGFPATLAASAWLAATFAVALYVYLVAGTIFQAGFIRLISLGIKPGRYPLISVTTLRWLIIGGIFTVSTRTVLPLIPVSFITNLYFRIVGCRMGRNVKLNSFQLNDAYLMTLGNDVIVGGQTDISCHLIENDHLVLQPIKVGDNTLIGAHSYLAPGVTVGSRCVIGLYTFIRSGRVVPDGTTITSLAGIDIPTARHIERGRLLRPLARDAIAQQETRREP